MDCYDPIIIAQYSNLHIFLLKIESTKTSTDIHCNFLSMTSRPIIYMHNKVQWSYKLTSKSLSILENGLWFISSSVLSQFILAWLWALIWSTVPILWCNCFFPPTQQRYLPLLRLPARLIVTEKVRLSYFNIQGPIICILSCILSLVHVGAKFNSLHT